MSNFYKGQKVVYIGGAPNPKFIEPKVGEIITLCDACKDHPNSWRIVEYPFGVGGKRQSVNEIRIRPLLTDSIKFAEETLKEVTEHIKSRELILNN